MGNDQSRDLIDIFRATPQIHLFSRDPLSFKNWDWHFIVRCNGYIIGLLHFIVLQIDPESEEFQFRILIIFWWKLIYHISLWYFLVEVILKFWHNHSTKPTRTRHIFSARTQIKSDPCQRVTLDNIHNFC